MNILRKIGRFIAKCIILFAICAFIYGIFLFFSDHWKDGIFPMIYSFSTLIFGGIILHFSKQPSEAKNYTAIDDNFAAFAGELVSDITIESVSIVGEVISETASAAVDVVSISSIDIPS